MENIMYAVASGDSFISKLFSSYYKAFIVEDRYKAYLKGLVNTLEISFFAIILGIVIGVLIAIIKVYGNENKFFRFLSGICNIYVGIIRGTPVMLQLLIIYNLVFTSRDTNELLVAALCFGFNSGAYVSEIVRAGIESIERGQMEAGRSLGLNKSQTMFLIIMPQAIKNILPALGNEFIVLIKETSVASIIAVTDLTKAAQDIGSRTWDLIPPLMISAVFYLIIVLGLTKLMGIFERRLAQGDRN